MSATYIDGQNPQQNRERTSISGAAEKENGGATQPKRRKRREPLMNSMDTGTGLGADESSPSVPSIISRRFLKTINYEMCKRFTTT